MCVGTSLRLLYNLLFLDADRNSTLKCDDIQRSLSKDEVDTDNTSLQISPVSFYHQNDEKMVDKEMMAENQQQNVDNSSKDDEKSNNYHSVIQPAKRQQVPLSNFVPHSILKNRQSSCEPEDKAKKIIKPTVISDDSFETEKNDDNIERQLDTAVSSYPERLPAVINNSSYVNIDGVESTMNDVEKTHENAHPCSKNLLDELSPTTVAVGNTFQKSASYYSNEV